MFSDEQREFLVFIILDYVVVWIYHSKRLKWILTYYIFFILFFLILPIEINGAWYL